MSFTSMLEPFFGTALLINTILLICVAILIVAIFYNTRRKYKNTELNINDILEQLPGYAYWKDKKGVCLGCNKNTWELLGLKSLADYIGKTDYDLFSKEEANILAANDQEVIQTGKIKIVEEKFSIDTGEKRLYFSHKIPLKNKKGHIVGLIGVSLDITQAKQKMEDRLALLENIIAVMPGHVYWKNKEGIYRGCNDNQAISAGFNIRKEILGKTDWDLPWKEKAENIRAVDLDVMKTGIPNISESSLLLADGTEATFLTDKKPLYKKDEIIGIVGISFDITDRKKLEALKMQQTIDEKNKNVMNILAGSIAHELRTPLAIININLDLLSRINKNRELQQEEKISKIEQFGEKIRQSIRDTTQVINMILVKLRHVVTNKVEEKNFKPYSMSEIIEEALSMYPFKVNEEKLIHYKNEGENFQTLGDAILTRHVLFNLIKNGLNAIAESGYGTVSIALNVDDKKFNRVMITDMAGGLSSDRLSKIFNKFETNDQTHNGAGLGLSFCKLVMQSYDGDILCESDEETYTRFTLIFPKL
jgi:two-component system aerobic respiration control sensor histidine kinase ArcB